MRQKIFDTIPCHFDHCVVKQEFIFDEANLG